MNRTERLLATILLLESAGRLRATDIAGRLEVSTRTVYRDLHALSEMGVPLVALPGQGYELMDGYFLPPLKLSPEEASALLLAGRILEGQAGGPTARAVASALVKLEAAFDDEARARSAALQRVFDFAGLGSPRIDLDEPRLVSLQAAILACRLVRLRYHGFYRDRPTRRDVEPQRLAHYDGAWHLIAYCRLRHEERDFRLDRIDHLEVLDEVFSPRPPGQRRGPPRGTLVRVRFAPEAARWVRERQHFSFLGEEADPEGVVMTYRAWRPKQILGWLLSWGAAAEVIAPASYRRLLAEEARRVADRYGDPSGQN